MSEYKSAELTNYGMSTVITHKVFGKYADEALKKITDENIRIEKLLSRFIPESEISKINRSAGIEYEVVSDETYKILASARELSKCCQGAFDITIGPLIDLWRNCKSKNIIPTKEEINQVLSLVNYEDLLLDSSDKRVKLRKIGQSIDLGGIGKGYAGDRFVDICKENEISSGFTNIGGNVVTVGTKPDGSDWKVGIQHPRSENSLIGSVIANNRAVVTSGDYQRFYIGNDGKRYHHILNPLTGFPTKSKLLSVTVLAKNSMMADALSTTLFIKGLDDGIKILKQFPGCDAIFIDEDLQIYITLELNAYFRSFTNMQINVLS